MQRLASRSPGWPEVVRRGLDLVGACLGLLLAGPILAVCALLIWSEDGGPVLYRRRMLGLGGQPIEVLKLRSMRADADEWLARHPELLAEYRLKFKLVRDPRVTRVGRVLRKLSVDELPQLVNVLRGEMSLVGPRPIHTSELASYGDFGARRLSVKPGLTGLWQVSGRHSVDHPRRVMLDRRYIEQRSLMMDLLILLRTPLAVLLGRGAC